MGVLRGILKANININDFDSLKIKLFVTATDLIKGQSVVFSKGSLFDAVVASASIPVIFKPVKIEDKLLVDGGILNNFPVEEVREICDIVIGSNVNKLEKGIGNSNFF